MLGCLRLSELIISRYLAEGNDRSMSLVFLNLGDFCHHSFINFLIFALIACLVAEMLIGSCRWRKIGRMFWSLDPNSAASLAKTSALSLPTESMCPDTQVNNMGMWGSVSVSFLGLYG